MNSGVWLAIGAALAFSLKGILVKLAIQAGADPQLTLTLRMMLAAPVFALVAFRPGQPAVSWKGWAAVSALGVLGYALSASLDFAGLATLGVGLERLVLYTHPAMVVALGALVLGRVVQRKQVVGMSLAWVGLAVAVLGEGAWSPVGQSGFWGGLGMVLASAFFYAIYLLGVEAWMPVMGSQRVGALATLSGTAVLLGVQLASRPEALFTASPTVWGLAAALALPCTVLPVLMLSAAIARIGPGRATTLGTIGPVAASGLGWAVLGEPLSLAQVVGSALVIGAVGVMGRSN